MLYYTYWNFLGAEKFRFFNSLTLSTPILNYSLFWWFIHIIFWYWYELNWIQLQLQIKDIDPVMILFIIIVLINLKRKYVFRWPKLLKNIFYYNVNMKTIQPQSYFTSFNNIYIYKNLQNTIFIYLKILKYSFTRVKNN